MLKMETTTDVIFRECAGVECDALFEVAQTRGKPHILCSNCRLERKRLRNRDQYAKKTGAQKRAKIDSGTN
jgi:hypothetical protein